MSKSYTLFVQDAQREIDPYGSASKKKTFFKARWAQRENLKIANPLLVFSGAPKNGSFFLLRSWWLFQVPKPRVSDGVDTGRKQGSSQRSWKSHSPREAKASPCSPVFGPDLQKSGYNRHPVGFFFPLGVFGKRGGYESLNLMRSSSCPLPKEVSNSRLHCFRQGNTQAIKSQPALQRIFSSCRQVQTIYDKFRSLADISSDNLVA